MTPTTYTNRPTEAFAVLSSPLIHKEIIDFCKRHYIPIYHNTEIREYNEKMPFIKWKRASEGYRIIGGDTLTEKLLSLEEFHERFKTVNNSISKEITYSIF